MPTDVQLVNQALVELGQDPIVTLTGGDEISVACNAIYADTRDAVLLLYPWHFATYQIGLPLSTFPPVFKWAHLYALPDGVKYGLAPHCLKVLETSEGEHAVYELAAHTVEGRVLYTHPIALGSATLTALAAIPYAIAYTGRVTDMTLWDALALRVLVKMLASTLAKAVTGQTALAEEKLKEALALLPAGQKEQDAQGEPIGLFPTVDALETQLRVANQALALLGQPSIRYASEDSERGYQMRLHFTTAAAAVLSMHPWNFAKFQRALTLSTEYIPPMRWLYAYDLPTGLNYGGLPMCLKVVGTDTDPGGWWEIGNDGQTPGLLGVSTGRVLMTHTPTCTIEYIGLVTNLGIWSPLAIEAFTAMLASKTALVFTKDAKLSAYYSEQALRWVQEAKRQDAKEGTPIRLRPSRVLLNRRLTQGGFSLDVPVSITQVVAQVSAPGRVFGMSTVTLAAADAVSAGGRMVAAGAYPAGTRVSMVVYQCTASFGTTHGLTAVDIGDAVLQDRWGQAKGIVFGTITDYGDATSGPLDNLMDGDLWVSAVDGAFDAEGTCSLFVLWERLTPP